MDTTGDGKGDSIQIKAINLLLPFAVPENIEIGDFDLKSFDLENFNFSEYVTLSLDDKPINISKNSVNFDTIRDRILIYHKGESFKLDDIIKGKLRGRSIALGDSISILIKLDKDSLNTLTEGEHFFKIDSDYLSNFTINFELDETNMNLKFDPKNT
ncbi:MAG: hypothetical protein ACFFG0_55450 [Candidatus Thorarchaeota archaeon]